MKEDYEVIIVGGGYGALICGAILARNGVKPLVVEKTDILGGGQAAVEIPKHRGYYTQMGHRDCHDDGDIFNVMGQGVRYGLEASDRAGANVKQIFCEPGYLRCHKLPERRVVPLIFDPTDLSLVASGYLQLPSELVPAFVESLKSIAGAEPKELMPITLGEWLAANVKEKRVQDAFRHLVINLMFYPPDKFSMGRFAELANSMMELWQPVDPEFPGMSGMIEPYARVIRENGGEIRMGLKTIEIVVKDAITKGIVVQDESAYTEMLGAPVVVCNLNFWDALDIMDSDLFPEELVRNAEKLRKVGGDVMTYNAGLSRMPTIRETNTVDDHISGNRLQTGPDWSYNGVWYFPSLTSEKVAPKGKHLLCAEYGTSINGPFQSFKEAKEKIDSLVEYMREYYKDLDEVTEWSAYFLNQNPSIAVWIYTGIPLPPMKIPTIEGLYFVGQSVDVPGGFIGIQDIGAKSGMDVADMILEGRI